MQQLHWCNSFTDATASLMQQVHWCNSFTDATASLMQQLHWCNSFTDATASLMQQLHWCNNFTDATASLMFANVQSWVSDVKMFLMFFNVLQSTQYVVPAETSPTPEERGRAAVAAASPDWGWLSTRLAVVIWGCIASTSQRLCY